MIDIRLTTSILGLNRTPAEKILLAYICQQAAASDGTCTDSNKDLAQATGLHLRTIPDLVKRLNQAQCLQASVDQSQANKRTLRPVQDLLEDYTRLYSSIANANQDYTRLSSSQNEDYTRLSSSHVSTAQQPIEIPHRLCPITGIDITRQAPEHKVANKATLYALYLSDRQRFEALTDRFLTPEQAQLPIAARCAQLSLNIQKLANAPLIDDAKAKVARLNDRLCPVTGVDIGRQRTDVQYVASKTLERLARNNTPVYLTLINWLMPEETPDLAYPGRQCGLMATLVREIAKSGVPFERPELPIRRCPVTGIDLTQQSPGYPLVTPSTLKRLFEQDRGQFDEVAAQFLTIDEMSESMNSQVGALNHRVRQQANWQTAQPKGELLIESKPDPTHQDDSNTSRLCPVTGINISHQDPRHRFLNDSTLRKLYRSDRSTYDTLLAQLAPNHTQASRDGQFMMILRQIRQLAKARGMDKAGPIRLYTLD